MTVDYLSAINKQGSGLNITQIVDSLVQAETAPSVDRLEKNITQKNAEISGYAIVASELQRLKSFSTQSIGSTAYTVSSDNSAIGVQVTDQSNAKAFSSSINVSALASAQTLEFTGFSSKNATINLGSVNIEFGEWNGNSFTQNADKAAQTVTVSSSNNSLSAFANSLSALSGVNATVTDKGDGTFSLIVNSDTGLKNALRLTVTEDPSDSGLSTFDTSSNNVSKQVVAAADASLTINGVSVSRSSNTINDLIDGYEFSLNSTTSSAASITSKLDADVAYSKVKSFVDLYNEVTTSIDSLTKKGLNGEESGVLARDVGVASIQKKLRSLISSELKGYEANGRYLSELGIKTERDGSISISEDDFKKKFSAEPILFDIMMNSLATSDSPLVKPSHDSTVLQPTSGVYAFSSNADGTSATLGGASLSGGTSVDGIKKYSGVSGDIKGLKLDVTGTVTSANIFYGQSYLSKLSDYIDDVISSTGTLAKSKLDATSSISEYDNDRAELDEKIASLTDRYMIQFSAMEAAVTGFKKTGEFLTGFIDALKPKD